VLEGFRRSRGRWDARQTIETDRTPDSVQRELTTWFQQEQIVKRTPINPWSWSLNIGFNQAELLEGHTRQLFCAGQTALDADGNPQHPGDMTAQLNLAFDNLETVLAGAGMTLANVVRLNYYTTNVDTFMSHVNVPTERFAAVGIMPPGTLLGVSRLAFPELLIELEATAAD
jgi:enamine deaminase RidA (YjgF/YER057c/UK114 family)